MGERLAIVALALVSACSGGTTPMHGIPAASSVSARPAAPPLPPGVLAEARGKRGILRVEEHEGQRLLTIDGVARGAVPTGKSDAASPVAPLLAIVRGVRPKAKTALGIGLGTGQSAAALAAQGFEVEVAEPEPPIIDFARRFFDYKGHAAESEGLEYVARANKTYDVVLVESFVEDQLPAEIRDEKALSTLGIRQGSSTLIAARWVGRPGRPIREAVPRYLNKVPVIFQTYGAGIGDEKQELYATLSAGPMNLIHPRGLSAWPVSLTASTHWRPSESIMPGSPASRRVTVLGYLWPHLGELYIDLPHSDNGALRYRLSGPKVTTIERSLPCCLQVPEDRVVFSPRVKKLTLRELLGGGTAEWADVRFSPMIIAVTGTATVAAVMQPGALRAEAQTHREDVPTDERLPMGGVLYDLAVEDVSFSFERKAWNKIKGALAAIAARTAAAIGARDFAGAEKSLAGYLKALEKDLGPFTPRMAIHVENARILSLLRAENARGAERTGLSAGAACDRVAHGAHIHVEDGASDDAKVLAAALDRCARRGYREALQIGGDGAKVAAARLRTLLKHDWLGVQSQSPQGKKLEAEITAIEKKYPGIQHLDTPPNP